MSLVSILLSSLLVGCPTEAPSTTPGGGPPGPGGEGAASGPPGPDGGVGGGGMVVDLTTMKAQTTQDELKAGEHITVSGTIKGDCPGVVSLHAIPTAGVPMAGPLTLLDAVPGAYSLALPKDTAIRLIPHCDGNKDGHIQVGVEGDLLAAPVEVAASATDVTGIDIDLSVAATPPSGPGGAGGGPGGAGGPGLDGGAGGAPPPGAGGPPGAEGAPAGAGGMPGGPDGAPPAGGPAGGLPAGGSAPPTP